MSLGPAAASGARTLILLILGYGAGALLYAATVSGCVFCPPPLERLSEGEFNVIVEGVPSSWDLEGATLSLDPKGLTIRYADVEGCQTAVVYDYVPDSGSL